MEVTQTENIEVILLILSEEDIDADQVWIEKWLLVPDMLVLIENLNPKKSEKKSTALRPRFAWS